MNSTLEPWRSEYPFASNFLTLEHGIRLHYVDESPDFGKVSDEAKENAPTNSILCVHGNPTWSFYYRSIVSHFSTRCRVVAVDHIGCGLSDKPQRYNYTLSQHIENLVGLIDATQLSNITLVVHDWGGAIGLGAALQRPDRFKNLLVLNTGAFPPSYIPLRISLCRIPWLGSWCMRHLNLFALAATRMALNRLPRLSGTAKLGLLAPYDSANNRIAIDRFVHDIPMSKQHPSWQVLDKIERNLPNLNHCSIRFVWGMRDWCFRPDCMERLNRAWPNATRRELADVGHYVMEEASSEVIHELEQLSPF
jgi:cis-3-alkyl-4-acyloxetan-2-one decarboxylase